MPLKNNTTSTLVRKKNHGPNHISLKNALSTRATPPAESAHRKSLDPRAPCYLVKPLSRTVGQTRVVDELIVRFTQDRETHVYLPGVAPTGRKAVLPHVVVMGFVATLVLTRHARLIVAV
jgi:hypothetical protein